MISLHELLTAAKQLAAASFQYTEPLLAALVYYLVIVSDPDGDAGAARAAVHVDVASRPRVAAPGVPAISHDAR